MTLERALAVAARIPQSAETEVRMARRILRDNIHRRMLRGVPLPDSLIDAYNMAARYLDALDHATPSGLVKMAVSS